MFEQIKKNKILNVIMPYISEKKVYIVGGFIRDILMNKSSCDIDLIIENCNIKEFSLELSKKINAYFIELDSENSIYRLVLEDKINYIDITKPIENDIKKDINRRDLTINAIVYDINEEKVIDLTGGIEDIGQKKIRGIANQNFEDDPLRLLRIFRFAATTGFEIDNNLIELTKKTKISINKIAKERINTELMKMFEGKYTDIALIKMYETGLLTEILPIFKEVEKIPKNSHHHLDLLHHSVETVKQIEILYSNAQEEVQKHLNSMFGAVVKKIAFLKLAGFLHDIGKPFCFTIDETTKRHRFIKHDEIGSNICVNILKDLKFSKKQTEYIKTLIKYHIYPSSMTQSPDVNEKAYMRFYRKLNENVIDVIILAMADRLSARGEEITQEMIDNNINSLTFLLNNYLKIKTECKPLPKLIDGHDVMKILNIGQSPLIGEIIKELKERQISGIINTRDEAVNFVQNYYVFNIIK